VTLQRTALVAVLLVACETQEPGSPALGQAGMGTENAGTKSAGGAPPTTDSGAGASLGGLAAAGSLPVAAAGGSVGTGAGAAGAGAAGAGGSGVAALVGVFVAQGHEGRITRSCDDGRTFPYNESEDDTFVCFSDSEHDCDHSAVAGRGLAFGAGHFVATWGWGHPGTLQRSSDGRRWTDVLLDTPTFADVAYGDGVFVACGDPTRVSRDGQTWEVGGKLSFDFNYRGIEHVPTAGGLFIVTGESGEQRAISLSKDGKTWTAASERPEACGEQLRGIAGSDSVALIASAKGHVCRSTDGRSWSYQAVAERFTSPPVWTGEEFWIYSGATLFKSADGQSWTSQGISPSGIAIGALARSPEGTLVAANDGWQVWYEKQQFFRSTNGVDWEVLPETAFTGSHPINFIDFGYVASSAGCGAP
jgi:hypothetical protein